MDIFRWPLGAQFESEKQTELTEISWKGALDPVEQLAATFFSSTLPNPHGDGQARQSNKTSWEKKKKGHHQLIRRRIRGHNRINPVQQLQTSKVVSSFRRFFLFLPLGVTSHTFWDRNEIYSEKKGNQPQSHAHIFAVSNFYFLSSFCFCRLGLLVTGHSSPHVRWTHVAYGGGLFLFYLFFSLSCCSFDYIVYTILCNSKSFAISTFELKSFFECTKKDWNWRWRLFVCPTKKWQPDREKDDDSSSSPSFWV